MQRLKEKILHIYNHQLKVQILELDINERFNI